MSTFHHSASQSSSILRFLGGTLISFASLSLLTGCDGARFSASQDKNLSVEVTNQKSLDVKTFNGEITVVAGSGKTIEVIAHVKAYGKTQEDADKALEELEPKIETTDDSIRLVAQDKKPKNGLFQSNSVAFEITVPKGLDLQLQTSNGQVSAAGTGAKVSVKTSNGEVDVADATDELNISTSNGSVSIESSTAKIDVSSSNGNIKAKNCTLRGNSELTTSNGSITAALSSESGPIELTAGTSNGKVEVDGEFESSSKSKSRASGVLFGSKQTENAKPIQLKLRSSNGNVRVSATEATGKAL